MKTLKLIYNPNSGDQAFANSLDEVITHFQLGGFTVHIYKSLEAGDVEKHILGMKKNYDALVICGGDGTINRAINAMKKADLSIPLGIIPSGTANDFASHMGISGMSLKENCDMICRMNVENIDLGKINDQYFINVCGGGLISNVSQNVDVDLKNILGKIAYYIDGLKQIPNFYPIPLKITNSYEVMEEEVYLFLILNGSGAGSFDKLAKNAVITDGKFDFVAIKARPILELAILFFKILRGEHLNDPNVIYFQDHYLHIQPMDDNPLSLMTDIDGEEGPLLPFEIFLKKEALRLIVP